MPLNRRVLLSLVPSALAGCAVAPSPTTEPAGASTAAAPQATPTASPVTSSANPAPPSAATTPDVDWSKAINGNSLDAHLASLGRFSGKVRDVIIKPGTYVRAKTISMPSGVRLIAYGSTFTSTVPGANGVLVSIKQVTDVSILGGTWDGNRSGYSGPRSEWRHCIMASGASRVLLDGVTTRNAQGDGIYVGVFATPCRDVTIRSVSSSGNARNGISVTSCIGLTCTDSTFDSNGLAELDPRAGIDIEPHDAAVVEDITFQRCTATKNGSRGFLYVTWNQKGVVIPAKGVTVDSCTFADNGTPTRPRSDCGGFCLIMPRKITITNSRSIGNEMGVTLRGDGQGSVVMKNCDISDNGGEGVRIVAGLTSLELTQVSIRDNSREGAHKHSGVFVDASSGELAIRQSTITGPMQRYALTANKDTQRIRLEGCVLDGNARGTVEALDNADVTVV